MGDADLEFWRRQSSISDPGAVADLLLALPTDADALTQISSQLVFHYRADGEWEANGIESDRADEINLCYAADMFERLLELDPSLSAARPPAKRILGCCRDFSTLYVSMLRQHGIACRCRVGFASYFDPGWWIDHVVVEVWDRDRWRMIDPEIRADFNAFDGRPLDRLDLHADRFMTASQAWLEAREGRLDPARAVVAPQLEIPETRGWSQLAHNLVHDIAALNRVELLLWQDWGASLIRDVLAPEVALKLDRAATATSRSAVPARAIQEWANHKLFRVPGSVRQVHPVSIEFSQVDVGRALNRN